MTHLIQWISQLLLTFIVTSKALIPKYTSHMFQVVIQWIKKVQKSICLQRLRKHSHFVLTNFST